MRHAYGVDEHGRAGVEVAPEDLGLLAPVEPSPNLSGDLAATRDHRNQVSSGWRVLHHWRPAITRCHHDHAARRRFGSRVWVRPIQSWSPQTHPHDQTNRDGCQEDGRPTRSNPLSDSCTDEYGNGGRDAPPKR